MGLRLLPGSRQRFESIVILRGLFTVIMVPDHPREFVHSEALRFGPAECQGSRPSRYPTVDSIDLAGMRGMFSASMDLCLSAEDRRILNGTLRAETKQAYLGIINELIAQGAEGIILGSTEIPMLLSQADVSVPVFDTTRLHARAAVEFALS